MIWKESQLSNSALYVPLFYFTAASPAKWTRKRNKSLGNIHSLVLLLSYLQERTTRLVANNEANSKVTFVYGRTVLTFKFGKINQRNL